jgi:hypothetical protein
MGEVLRLEAAQEVTFGLPGCEEPAELGCFRREDCALVGNHLLFRISMKNFFIIRKDFRDCLTRWIWLLTTCMVGSRLK